MRLPPTSIQAASLLILSSVAACSSDNPAPATDAATSTDIAPVDSSVPMDGSTPADAATADASDAARARDVFHVTDVQFGDVPTGSIGVSSLVGDFITAARASNWSTQNRSRGIMMHGCNGVTNAADCLADVPEAGTVDGDIGADHSAIDGAHLRVLFTSTAGSAYWTRSSADGRFIGRGTKIHDLVRDIEINAAGAMYDPAFFPDNNGFMYQPGGRMCPQSALTTGMPTSVAITGTGSPCAGSSVGLYEHLAAALGGGDYWATSAGTAAWDDGGHAATLTETARNEAWNSTAQVTLSLMANTGSGFSFVASRSVSTPFQGDAVISPSGRVMITRFVDDAGVYQGYVLHRLDATHTGAAVMVTTTEMARYAQQGAKPSFSYDERYVAYHHYIGGGATADADAHDLGFTDSSDPGFADYTTRGASNIYLLDLLTGISTRVTTMAPGQYALYPHFRSDGWMYFLVRTLGTRTESVIASDALLVNQ